MPNNINRDRKEELSIYAIKGHIFDNNLPLKSYINTGDKEISFDGHISVNEGLTDSKKDFIRKVDVQVKSIEVHRFSGKKAKFQAQLDDLRNYYKQEGCLLLLVQIKNSSKMKIYYKQLLPLELYEIINDKSVSKKKTKSLDLRELDETDLYVVCMKYIYEKEKQPKNLIEIKRSAKDFGEVRVTSPTFDKINFRNIEDILEHDFIRYGVQGDLEIPIDTISPDVIVTRSNMSFIVLGDNNEPLKHTLLVKVTVEKRGILKKWVIENSLNLNFDFKNKIFDLVISDNFYSLKSKLKTLPLLIQMFKYGNLIIETNGDFQKLEMGNNNDELVKALERELKIMNQLRWVYTFLNIDEEMVFIDETNIKMEINFLIKSFYQQDFSDIDFERDEFINIDLGGNSIIVFYAKESVHHLLLNPFNAEMDKVVMYINDPELTEKVAPTYLLLSRDLMSSAININYSFINERFHIFFDTHKENLDLYSHFNHFILECLSAYDIKEDIDALNLVITIAEHMINNPSKKWNDIIKVNYFQTKLRLNSQLTESEYGELITIKEKADSQSYLLKFCVSVLLGHKKEADYFIAKLNKGEGKEEDVQNYPIHTLYLKLK
ncbi:hypothetical protein [Shouchella patagoniensis]|uniref:hypothetical protein n=1 Tax=Shouchella patagoniensis TaxID=228576 RepID=UPI00099529C7|nr:hypothetical protein [Shouchella patagoniensis]